ncbi:MAG: glycosyltransferase [Candidatus Omnitrophica bacterium]|nr:glycosyltransferase [Candidatus Omnitrophota bacterium]
MPLKPAIDHNLSVDIEMYQEIEPSFYDDQLKSKNPLRSLFHKRRYQLINSFVKSFYHPGKRIIDVGAGSSAWNRDCLPVFGLDLNYKLLDYGKSKRRISDYRTADLLDSGLEDRSFDIAVASEVLEHISDIDNSLKQIQRVLVDDGVLIASVPYDARFSTWRILFFFQRLYKGYLRGNRYYRNNCGHVHHFSPQKFKDAFIKNGFEIEALFSSYRCSIFLIARKKRSVAGLQFFPDLSIIIPVKNEAANIGKLLDDLTSRYGGMKIYLVDDGSTDGTLEIIENKKKSNGSIMLIDRRYKKVKGLTVSVLEAIDRIESKYFIVMDGDLQHEGKYIERIYNQLRQNNDICVVSRLSVAGWRLNRKMISYFGTFLGKTVLFLRKKRMPHDILSGYFGANTDYWRNTAGGSQNKFSLRGYKILFDFLKKCGTELRLSDIYHILNTRTSGNSKIYWLIYFEYIRALLRG